MDLPYPSLKDDQLTVHLSPNNHRRSLVIKDSLKNVPSAPCLPQSLRKKIINLLQQDLPYELRQLINKQVVSFRSQIGREGSYQNILHVSCRQNAAKSLQYVCKTYYQYFPEDYQNWVNTPTKQGLTAVMICALSQSHQCLTFLLKMGGVDIHLIDGNKLSAYQMALNCKNEAALKLLMQFQNKGKKQKLMNNNLLSQQVQLKKGRVGICQTFFKCLLDCITCGSINQKDSQPRKQHKKTVSLLGAGIDGLFKDQVEIGYTSEQLGFQVEWKLMGEYQQKGNYGVLLQNFSPYDMEDVNCPTNNLLILFQSLSQHPWLVRRVIQSQKGRPGSYTVNVFQKNISKSITVDAYLPFVAKTTQPVFIADKKQGWPMLLQKAMAKMYGSYRRLKSIGGKELLENMTGWPGVQLQLSGRKDIYGLLKRFFFAEKYMYILQGKANSLLSHPDGSISSFTVLNFYQKADKRLVLINCPFVDPAWMEKERHEILALKILRGHFNCRNQMTIWVQQQRLSEYFSKVIVAPVKSGYQRQSLNVTVTDKIYFKLDISTSDQCIVVYVIDTETGLMIPCKNIEGWKNEKDLVQFSPSEFRNQGVIQFQSTQGEYFFKIDASKGKYLVVVWSPQLLKIQPLQQTFALLEWTSCFRKNIYQNWGKEQHSFVGYTAGCSVIIIRSQLTNKRVNLKGEAQIIEGKRLSGEDIQMVNQGEYGYIVVRGCIKDQAIYYQC